MIIDILIEDQRWQTALPNIEDYTKNTIIQTSLRAKRSNPVPTDCHVANAPHNDNENLEISIVLTNDADIKILNKTYRGKDKSTNVLSFPQHDDRMLGDVIIALETIQREASEQDKTLDHHYTHMLIHGTLHLLGYDHETEEDSQEMESLEIKLLENLGIKNPYETQ